MDYKLHQFIWICNNIPQMAQSSIKKQSKSKTTPSSTLQIFPNRSTKPTTKNLPARFERSRKRSRSVYLEITPAFGDCRGKAHWKEGLSKRWGEAWKAETGWRPQVRGGDCQCPVVPGGLVCLNRLLQVVPGTNEVNYGILPVVCSDTGGCARLRNGDREIPVESLCEECVSGSVTGSRGWYVVGPPQSKGRAGSGHLSAHRRFETPRFPF